MRKSNICISDGEKIRYNGVSIELSFQTWIQLTVLFLPATSFCQIYSLARDGAVPLSSFWYNMDPRVGGPVRSIWLSVVLAFILGEAYRSHSILLFATLSKPTLFCNTMLFNVLYLVFSTMSFIAMSCPMISTTTRVRAFLQHLLLCAALIHSFLFSVPSSFRHSWLDKSYCSRCLVFPYRNRAVLFLSNSYLTARNSQ